MKRPWFKFFTRDFRDGVRRMSNEQIGVYVKILSLMYERPDGKLPDNDRDICLDANVSYRVWKRVRSELIGLNKLAVEGEFLINSRVSKEISFAEVLRKKRQNFGKTGGINSGNSRRKTNEINDEAEAFASVLLHPETQRHRDTDNKLDKSSLSARDRAPPKPKKSRRIATDATLPKQPTPDMAAFAGARGFVNGALLAEFAKWRDYHIGHGTTIADEEASFRTWIGKAVEYRKAAKPNGNSFADRPAIYPNPYRG